MFQCRTGNILQDESEALVNAVNCVGVMGRGLALEFKKAFPANFAQYEEACAAGRVVTGTMFFTRTGQRFSPFYIVNFPTKRHWRDASRLADIESGLADLRKEIVEREIKSVAVPALGCGLGGLNWNDVLPLIKSALGDLEAAIYLYGPRDSSLAPPAHTY